MVSSITAPPHKHSVGASGTAYSSTTGTGMEQPLQSPVTAIALYDMARIKSTSTGEGSDTKEEKDMKIQVQQSVSESYDV